MGSLFNVNTSLCLTFLALTVTTVTAQLEFFGGTCTTKKQKMCVSLGSGSDTIGEYRGDSSLITYMNLGGVSTLQTYYAKIQNTASPLAFITQMTHSKAVSFFIGVDLDSTYEIELGFAHVTECKGSGTTMKVIAGDVSSPGFNVLKQAGCRKAYFVKLQKVKPGPWKLPGKGKIIITVLKTGGSGLASIATMCVTQNSGSTPSECSQTGCTLLSGKYGYASAHGPGCKHTDSFAFIDTPKNAQIVKAYMRWTSFYDDTDLPASITINGETVTADKKLKSLVLSASADITKLVSKTGTSQPFRVTNFMSERCEDAMWNMVVIYQLDTLPTSHINLCSSLLTGNTYSFQFSCIHPIGLTAAKMYLNFVETNVDEAPTQLFANSVEIAKNIFSGSSGPGADYLSLDVTERVKSSKFYFNVTKKGGIGYDGLPILDLVETM